MNRHQKQSLRKQQGVVIVVALFIVALVASLAYVMMARLERDTRRNLLLQRDAQAAFYAQGSISWALDQLKNNADHARKNKLTDVLPIQSPEIVLNGYQITSTIYDMQDRFNINNVNVNNAAAFGVLLKNVAPQVSEENLGEILSSIVDWISQNNQDSVLNKYYFSQPLPYRAAHRPMKVIGELNLVKGMTPALYTALKPYVVALPVNTKINVINAQAPVLLTLSDKLTLADANAIVKAIKNKKIATMEAFLALPLVKKADIRDGKITVKSNYFLVETEVKIENQRTLLYTLLKRPDNDHRVSIEWQSKNVY